MSEFSCTLNCLDWENVLASCKTETAKARARDVLTSHSFNTSLRWSSPLPGFPCHDCNAFTRSNPSNVSPCCCIVLALPTHTKPTCWRSVGTAKLFWDPGCSIIPGAIIDSGQVGRVSQLIHRIKTCLKRQRLC